MKKDSLGQTVKLQKNSERKPLKHLSAKEFKNLQGGTGSLWVTHLRIRFQDPTDSLWITSVR